MDGSELTKESETLFIPLLGKAQVDRSEERRVGKEC